MLPFKHTVIFWGRQNGRKTMQDLLNKKQELEVKLDHYSRTDRVAFDRVLMDLFEVELDIREMMKVMGLK